MTTGLTHFLIAADYVFPPLGGCFRENFLVTHDRFSDRTLILVIVSVTVGVVNKRLTDVIGLPVFLSSVNALVDTMLLNPIVKVLANLLAGLL